MMRTGMVLLALLGLAACGGGNVTRGYQTPAALYATGPIQAACQRAGRKAASRTRCGCVQAVADRELSAQYQRRGAGYFSDPHRLQEVRQSDNASNERFWKAWKAYGQRAAELCSGT